MKKKYSIMLWAILIIVLVAVEKQFAQYSPWIKNVEVNEVEFEKIRYLVQKGDTITIIGKMKNSNEINGYPCKAGWIHFSKNWEPKLFCLSKNCSIWHVNLGAGTWVIHKPESDFIYFVFPKDTFIQRFECKGGGGPKGTTTAFYKNGALCSFFSSNDLYVGNIYCKGGLLNVIRLHENGKLQSCKLAKGTVINHVKYNRGCEIAVNVEGKVIKAE